MVLPGGNSLTEVWALLLNIVIFAIVVATFNFGVVWLNKQCRSTNPEAVEGEGLAGRLLFCCAAQENGVGTEVTRSGADEAKPSWSVKARQMAFAACGLQIFYLTWGALQERVMTKPYGGERFGASEFLVFSNRFAAFLVATVMITWFDPVTARAPFRLFSLPAFSNIISSWCQYSALKFVSFPVQVVFKSNKIIPVMLMGRLIAAKQYKWHEYITAGVISGGILLFMFGQKKGADKKSTTDVAYEKQVAGMCLLLGYICFDSFTSQFQGKIFKQHKISPYRMMQGINFFSIIFTASSAIASGSLLTSINFGTAHPLFFAHVAGISCCGAAGQLLIYYTIKTFGPLVFTIIMATRQLLSIIISCFLYGHTIAALSALGMLIVFSTIALRIYLNYRARNATKEVVSTTMTKPSKEFELVDVEEQATDDDSAETEEEKNTLTGKE